MSRLGKPVNVFYKEFPMFRKIWLPIAVVAATFIFTIIVTRCYFMTLIDIPSFVIVPVLSSIVPSLVFGATGVRNAFRAPFEKNPSGLELRASVAFFKALGTSSAVFGMIGMITGLVSMFRDISDRSQVGPRLALALLSLFYAVLVWAFVVMPFMLNAKKRLAELEG